MYIDVDSGGKVSIMDMDEKEAKLVQIALLAMSEPRPEPSTPEKRFFRRLAIKIDKILTITTTK